VRVHAIVGSTAETARAAATACGVGRWSADWHEVLVDDAISAVHVCTPNDLHLPIAAAALSEGKHVICEKPLTRNAAEAAELVELAKRHPELLCVLGYKYRYAPLLHLMRDHVVAGSLGRVHDVRGSYLQSWMLGRHDANSSSWRRDLDQGGRDRVLLDIGTHLLDLMETIVDRRLARLQTQSFRAETGSARQRAGEDGAHLLARYDDGTAGVAVVSQVSAAHTHRITVSVDGVTGSAHWTLADVETLVICDAADMPRLELRGGATYPSSGRYWRRDTDPDRLLVPLLAHAYTRVRLGAHDPEAQGPGAGLPNFEDGRRHSQLLDSRIAIDQAHTEEVG
jgi:predicted dehydrogenase